MNLAEEEPERGVITLSRLRSLSTANRAISLLLLGEFSAGKSSLVNLLIGTDLLPTGVLATTRRLARLRFADNVEVEAIDHLGNRNKVDASLVTTHPDVAFKQYDIGIPCERLRHVVLVDTPGFADPDSDPSMVYAAVEQCDIAIWCTRAQQAWRHSERAIWSSLPSRLRETGLLVVTRRDQLGKSADQKRLMARLRKDAGAMFHGIVLLSIPDAARAQGKQPEELDVALWKNSGGEALAIELLRSLSVVIKRALPDQASPKQHTAGTDQDADRNAALVAPPLEPVAPEQAEPGDLESSLRSEVGERGALPIHQAVEANTFDNKNEIDSFLATCLATIDRCKLAACIDLRLEKVVSVLSKTSSPSERILENIASLAVSMFAGMGNQFRGEATMTAGTQVSYASGDIETVTIEHNQTSHILCRVSNEPDQAIVLSGVGQPSIVSKIGLVQVGLKRVGVTSKRETPSP